MRTPRPSGFTLIELMIAVAVVAILATIAYPSYLESVRKTRRAEAMKALAQVQQAQERWRSNHPQYGTESEIVTDKIKAENYKLALSDVTATGYKATATAQAKQADDSKCATFTLTVKEAVPDASYTATSSSCLTQ